MAVIPKPLPDEYLHYYGPYIGLVPECDLAVVLPQQLAATRAIFGTVTPAKAGYRYADGKWSVREVLGHMTDVERIMTYRLLRVARADTTALPGFDEGAYVPVSGAEQRTTADLVDEFAAVRGATVALFRGLPADAWSRIGNANGHPISARALGYIVAGHERHHLETLRARYGVGMQE
ncbi:MAG: DinB family protein [Gemmatimonadota bacterium]